MKKKLIPVYARAFTEKIKYVLFFCLVFTFTQTATAQTQKIPPQKEKNICGISSKYSTFINKRVSEKIALLRANGKLNNTAPEGLRQAGALATPVSFRFPLADIKHRDFASWRMFNYVDLDPDSYDDGYNTNPNEIGDYNCGDRCYDYHSGMDILLEPYYWKEQTEQSIWVIAAAPGVIVDKHDGAFDEECDPPASVCSSEPDNRGNYVVILHDDGSTATFYMHMVQNSITTKQEGDRVYAGDYLGIAGSSGCSSGPHLHFEVRTGYIDDGPGYESTGTVVDPFANGSCAVSPSSWWISEPPYNDPAVLTMESHYADPESFTEGSDWCDQTLSLYPDNTFTDGQTIYLRTKFRDWNDGSTANFSIYKPDGTLWRQYTKTNPGGDRGYIPSDASYGFTSLDPDGTYRYTVTFGGKTYSHYFTKDCQYSLGMSGSLSGHKGYMVSYSITSTQTISGLSTNYVKFMADDHVTLTPGFRAFAGCKFVANTKGCNNSTNKPAQCAVATTNETQNEQVIANKDVKGSGLAVYPNPSTGVFSVRYQNSKVFNATIVVRNTYGQVVYTSQSVKNITALQQNINLSNKPKGIYIVEINTGEKRVTAKLVLQ